MIRIESHLKSIMSKVIVIARLVIWLITERVQFDGLEREKGMRIFPSSF